MLVQESKAAFKPWRDRILPYINEHCTSDVDHIELTEQFALEVNTLGVQVVPIPSLPDPLSSGSPRDRVHQPERISRH